MSLTSLWYTSRWIDYTIVLLLYFKVWRKSSFDFGSKLWVLTTRGKWTSSLRTCIYIYIFVVKIYLYIHNCKSEVSKSLNHYSCFIHTWILLFLVYYFKLYMLRMTQNYIFEKLFVIWYITDIDNIVIK